jgi:hypothetical protein
LCRVGRVNCQPGGMGHSFTYGGMGTTSFLCRGEVF